MAGSDEAEKGSEPPVSDPAAASSRLEQSAPPATEERQPPGPLRVLVVDDNEDLARALARLLELSGHQVRVAYDGPSGFDQAREWLPDFILLDVGLPGMDGFQVASLLRQNEDTRHAVIIAISGYGLEEDRLGSQQAGFDHYLIKPIDTDELAKILRGNDRPDQ